MGFNTDLATSVHLTKQNKTNTRTKIRQKKNPKQNKRQQKRKEKKKSNRGSGYNRICRQKGKKKEKKKEMEQEEWKIRRGTEGRRSEIGPIWSALTSLLKVKTFNAIT